MPPPSIDNTDEIVRFIPTGISLTLRSAKHLFHAAALSGSPPKRRVRIYTGKHRGGGQRKRAYLKKGEEDVNKVRPTSLAFSS